MTQSNNLLSHASAAFDPDRETIRHPNSDQCRATLESTEPNDRVKSTKPSLADALTSALGVVPTVRFDFFDGSTTGQSGTEYEVVVAVRNIDALRRLLFRPTDLGLARAYVCGDITIQGDLRAVLALRDRLPRVKVSLRQKVAFIRLLKLRLFRPVPPPREEVLLRGRKHSLKRDAEAISAHYDLPVAFFKHFLDATLTYSCAIFENDTTSLQEAQNLKLDQVCRDLGLDTTSTLLDIGCGWGSLVCYAAQHYGARCTGLTLSRGQAEYANQLVQSKGLADLVVVGEVDYRCVNIRGLDAVASIEMSEHVGTKQLRSYFRGIRSMLRPSGILVHQSSARPPGGSDRLGRWSFSGRYVWPDAELQSEGEIISSAEHAGFEVLDVKSVRMDYVMTLDRWIDAFEGNWNRIVDCVGVVRARAWLLNLSGARVHLAANRMQVYRAVLRASTAQTGH